MSTWKQLIAKPAGSMPGGALTQWAVGIGTLLMAALFMFWPYFGGDGEAEIPATGSGQQPAGPGMQDRTAAEVREENLRQQQQRSGRGAGSAEPATAGRFPCCGWTAHGA